MCPSNRAKLSSDSALAVNTRTPANLMVTGVSYSLPTENCYHATKKAAKELLALSLLHEPMNLMLQLSDMLHLRVP